MTVGTPALGFNDALLERIQAGKPRRAPLEKAVIVCQHQLQRSLLSHQFRQIGVSEMRFTARHAEVRRLIESGHVDLIVFDEEETSKKQESAQALIDELRRCGLLEIQTIVIITASRATYSQVSEAAESGIDSYILRPYSLSGLQARLEASLARRESMKEIYAALKRKDYDSALEACLFKFAEKSAFWLYAARIAAEIYIAKGKPQQAQHLYEEIVRQEALPWAKLGIGRALVEQGRHDAAIEHLNEVIEQHPEQTDAYDLMGRAHLERGDREKALEVYRLAVRATPSSVSRLQRLAFAEYYAGNIDEALKHLERSVQIGIKSKSFDLQALWVLAYEAALGHHEKKLVEAQRRLQQCMENPLHDHERLLRLKLAIDALSFIAARDLNAAKETAAELIPQASEPSFDFDSACNLVSLVSLLASRAPEKEAASYEEVIDGIGMRFSHSRLASAWLAKSANAFAPFESKLATSHEHAFRQAQEIMRCAVLGQAQKAAEDIVALAETTFNARIIEMAERMLERHGAKVNNLDDLKARIDVIKKTNDPVVLRRNPSSRQLRHPGGISLLQKL